MPTAKSAQGFPESLSLVAVIRQQLFLWIFQLPKSTEQVFEEIT